MNPDTRATQAADQAHAWHPFTQHQDWGAPGHEPLVLVEGAGAVLCSNSWQAVATGEEGARASAAFACTRGGPGMARERAPSELEGERRPGCYMAARTHGLA